MTLKKEHPGFINVLTMQPYGVLMVSPHRLGSEEKNLNQFLTGTAVARDTTLKKAYKRTNGVLLR